MSMSMGARALCARNLRRLRRDAGLAPVDLAQAADMPVATLLAIEECVCDVGIDEIDRLARHLRVPLRDLFLDEAVARPSIARRARSG